MNGITLIALVITIIVLLILAGVTLSLVAGENGILKRATNAVDVNEKATAKEETNLLVAEIVMQYYEEKYVNHKEVGELNKYIQNELKTGKKTSEGNYEVIADEDGKVQVFQNGKVIVTGEIINGKVQWPNELEEISDSVGQVINKELVESNSDEWHVCDGSVLKIAEYPILAQNRKDLVQFVSIDCSPIFSGPNSRVNASGSADGNWPAYLVFSPTLVNTAGSGWISQGGTGEKWISVDMEENVEVNKMEFTNVNHQGRKDCVGAPIDFSIKGSLDHVIWEDILNITGNEHIEMEETYSYTFPKVSYRYYKIEITNGVQWWDGNLFYGFRFWKLINEEEMIKLPNDLDKVIKIK